MNFRNSNIGGGGISFPVISYSEDSFFNGSPYTKNKKYDNFNGYNNVIESTGLNNLPGTNLYLYKEYNQFVTIWFAPKIGPIKYKLRNGQILNLKNYHIIQ